MPLRFTRCAPLLGWRYVPLNTNVFRDTFCRSKYVFFLIVIFRTAYLGSPKLPHYMSTNGHVEEDLRWNDPDEHIDFPALPPLPLSDNGQNHNSVGVRLCVAYAMKSKGFSATKEQIASFAISKLHSSGRGENCLYSKYVSN